MPSIIATLRSGEVRQVEGLAGSSVKQVLMDGGVTEIDALTSCGGCASCGTCHVIVSAADAARVPPISQQEDDLLYVRDDRVETSRLACQLILTDALDGLRLTIPPEW
jgi:2Fe-2S ferredoxin